MSFDTAPRSGLYVLADRLLNGQLAERLRAERERGKSFEAIARELYAEANIPVTGGTVSKWCRRLGIEAAA